MASLILCELCFSAAAQEKRPNFVWFMAEDMSRHYLSLYNDGEFGAMTPNVQRLADEGLMFNNAYSSAPVSSAARTSLFTSCYAPRLGCSFHRKLQAVPLPDHMRMFPSYLRASGYYTLNSDKTDYNCVIDTTAWDNVKAKPGEWRERNPQQPFFFVRTEGCSHESSLHFKKDAQSNSAETSTDDVFIHPNHPDTPLMRSTYARFYDKIEQADRELGNLLDMLEADGLMDNTFIFFFGDNGGSLPGTKGYTTETGLNVPLVIYIPKEWRSRLQCRQGESNGFVSFVDFGPTLLHLAGIDVPEWMDGKPFLGEGVTEQELLDGNVFCYGDRFDELYAFNRTLRRGNYKYSRNFVPYHSKSLFAFYRYKQAAFAEWKALYDNRQLNDVQSAFFLPQGPEELYDLSTDPYETRNLATDRRYRKVLLEMRSVLKSNMLANNDLGLCPECEWVSSCSEILDFGERHSEDIARYSDIADLQMLPFGKVKKKLMRYLESPDPVDRYWAATACAWFGNKSGPLALQLRQLLDDDVMYVRSRAVVALSYFDEECKPEEEMKQALLLASSGVESLMIMNDMAHLKEKGYTFDVRWADVPKKAKGVSWRINYMNSR